MRQESLVSEVRGPRFSRSQQNIGICERGISAVVGAKLILSGLSRLTSKLGALGMLMTTAGSYLIYRGVSGRCPVYTRLGVRQSGKPLGRSASTGIRVSESITVRRPVEKVYAFWRDLRNLPKVMRHVDSIDVIDNRRSVWRVKGVGGIPLEWEALVTNERPNELLEWVTVDSEFVHQRGMVEFQVAPGDRGTMVRVSLLYRPIGGSAVSLLNRLFGRDPATEIREALRHLKQFLETGEIADATGPSGRNEPLEEAEIEYAQAALSDTTSASGEDVIEEASKESFPASDAPAWSQGRT